MTTFETELERDKADKIKEVASRGAAKAADLGYDGEAIRGFLRHYFRHVDAARRGRAQRRGAARVGRASHYDLAMNRPVGSGHHRDPHPRPVRRRLDERGDRGPDRHRRPAVPGRLGDDGGAPPGLEHPRGLPPPVPRRPRSRRHPARHPASRPGRQRRPRRGSDERPCTRWPSPGCTWRSCRRAARGHPDQLVAGARAGSARGAPAGRGGGPGLAEDAAPGPRRRVAHAPGRGAARRPSRPRQTPAAELLQLARSATTSPSSATASTATSPTIRRRRSRAVRQRAGHRARHPARRRRPAPTPSTRCRCRPHPQLMVITKDNHKSRVHRPAYLDYLGLPAARRRRHAWSASGASSGCSPPSAYSEAVRRVPLLRQKAQEVLRRSGYDESSHGGKAIMDVLDTYPRDELFQTPRRRARPVVEKVAHLKERRQVRLFVRRDPYGRYLSCLVYLPRDRYTTAVRNRMQDILLEPARRVDDRLHRPGDRVGAGPAALRRPDAGRRRSASVDVRALERELTAGHPVLERRVRRAAGRDALRRDGRRRRLAADHWSASLPEGYKEDYTPQPGDPDLAGADEPVAGRTTWRWPCSSPTGPTTRPICG